MYRVLMHVENKPYSVPKTFASKHAVTIRR